MKIADKILEDKPNHPETLSLKGFAIFNEENRMRGIELMKEVSLLRQLKLNLVAQQHGLH